MALAIGVQMVALVIARAEKGKERPANTWR
jgi:hypothetical protein